MKKTLLLTIFWSIAAIAGMAITGCSTDDETGGEGQIVVDPQETGDSILLYANFNNTIPSSWINIDQDGDGEKWRLYSDIFGYGDNGYENSDCLASSSWKTTTPDNLIVSPEIHIPGSGGYVLSYYIGGLVASRCSENYSVYVGHMVNGEFLVDGTLKTGVTPNCFIQQEILSLDNYRGHDIRIAFRHHNTTDMGYLLLDEISVAME